MNMQAVRIHEFGGPEVMKVEELPLPVPGEGQALVRIRAASVNYLDLQHRRGELENQRFYKEKAGVGSGFPTGVGTQGAGVVEALGPGAQPPHVRVGARVLCAGVTGTYATHALAPAAWLIPIPDELSFEEAAAGLAQGFLAYAFTRYACPVQPGDWCLVQAAAGGLGHLIVQMIRLRGGRAIGVVSKAEKAQAVREAGAEEVIVAPDQTAVAEEVRRLTGGQGARVVFDGVGKDSFEANLDSLGPGGYLVIYGQASGYVPPFDLMKLQEKGSLFLTRTNGLPYRKHWPEYAADFVPWVREGRIQLRIDSRFPLAEAAAAHRKFESREVVGRMVLLPE